MAQFLTTNGARITNACGVVSRSVNGSFPVQALRLLRLLLLRLLLPAPRPSLPRPLPRLLRLGAAAPRARLFSSVKQGMMIWRQRRVLRVTDSVFVRAVPTAPILFSSARKGALVEKLTDWKKIARSSILSLKTLDQTVPVLF